MTDPLLSVDELAVSLGGTTILDGASLGVERGELVGLVGPNGAGKTTLLRAINGVLDPDNGVVSVDGQPLTDVGARERSRLLATVPQDTSVSFSFPVETIVEMGRTPHRRRTEFGASDEDHEAVQRALERTDTAGMAERALDELSGGERQRVFVARAIAQETPVLLLDEPTASLDVNHQIEILGLVRDLIDAGRGGLAAIHDLDLAARFCDRLVVLHDGSVAAAGPPERVLHSDVVDPAFDATTAVAPDPVTGTPSVTALDSAESDGRRVHVLGGGRAGARAIAELSTAGHDVTTGPLRQGDLALSTARSLDVPAVTAATVGRVDDETVLAAEQLAADADVAVLADVEIGPTQWTLDLADGFPAVVLLEDRPLEKRLSADQRGRERYDRLRDRGETTTLAALAETVAGVTPRPEAVADD